MVVKNHSSCVEMGLQLGGGYNQSSFLGGGDRRGICASPADGSAGMLRICRDLIEGRR